MELVVIIYGIAWIIVLLYLLYIHFTEKDKLFRRDNWKLSLFVITFAPIIFLVMLLCIPISCIWDRNDSCILERGKRSGYGNRASLEKTGC